jgi:hypothetical protein
LSKKLEKTPQKMQMYFTSGSSKIERNGKQGIFLPNVKLQKRGDSIDKENRKGNRNRREIPRNTISFID